MDDRWRSVLGRARGDHASRLILTDCAALMPGDGRGLASSAALPEHEVHGQPT